MTARQEQVAKLIAKGMCNKEIAVALGVCVRTVKYFVSSLYPLAGVNRGCGGRNRGKLQEQCRAGIFDENLTSIDG